MNFKKHTSNELVQLLLKYVVQVEVNRH